MLCPGAPLWYAHVAFELYHLGNGDWKTFPGMATTKWFSNNEGHNSEYAMGIGENWSLGERRELS